MRRVRQCVLAVGLLVSALLGVLHVENGPPPPPVLNRELTTMVLSRYLGRSTPLNNSDTLWAVAWQMAAVEDVTSLAGAQGEAPLVSSFVHLLNEYWRPNAVPPSYAPYRDASASGVRFYDDNAWAGLDLFAAYRSTGHRFYLHRAEQVFAFEMTGWAKHGGGLYWNTFRDTRNTTSTEPAAELATLLYRATHQGVYLRDAIRLNRWEEHHLVDQKTGAVWDRMDHNGYVVKDVYSYNLGSVIAANVLLYQVTKNPENQTWAGNTFTYILEHPPTVKSAVTAHAAFDGVLADDLRLYIQDTGTTERGTVLRILNGMTPPLSPAMASLNQSGVLRLKADEAALSHRDHQS